MVSSLDLLSPVVIFDKRASISCVAEMLAPGEGFSVVVPVIKSAMS